MTRRIQHCCETLKYPAIFQVQRQKSLHRALPPVLTVRAPEIPKMAQFRKPNSRVCMHRGPHPICKRQEHATPTGIPSGDTCTVWYHARTSTPTPGGRGGGRFSTLRLHSRLPLWVGLSEGTLSANTQNRHYKIERVLGLIASSCILYFACIFDWSRQVERHRIKAQEASDTRSRAGQQSAKQQQVGTLHKSMYLYKYGDVRSRSSQFHHFSNIRGDDQCFFFFTSRGEEKKKEAFQPVRSFVTSYQ